TIINVQPFQVDDTENLPTQADSFFAHMTVHAVEYLEELLRFPIPEQRMERCIKLFLLQLTSILKKL
ncbi:hypothetical protein HK099_001812, partial [Clydaea vesicula]